jgi:hypothetical protein
MKLTHVTYHRNGISGRGFWAANCKHAGEELIIVRLEGDNAKGTECLALSRTGGASSTWRGDHFTEEMDKAIEVYKRENWKQEAEQVLSCLVKLGNF